jgi:hypothetical protein
MENKTRFDLESAITHWRAQLTAHETVGPDELRELEAHLRDSVAGWTTKGLRADEAFQIASARLGPPEKVAAEFAKEDPITPWRTRLFWMLIGSMALNVLSHLGHTLTTFVYAINDRIAASDGIPPRTVQYHWIGSFIVMLGTPFALYFLSKYFLSGRSSFWLPLRLKFFHSRFRMALLFVGALSMASMAPSFAALICENLLKTAGMHFGPHPSLILWLTSLAYPVTIGVLAARVAPSRFLTTATEHARE